MSDPINQTVMPGAEPFHHDGGPVGVLVVHGFTGSPSSMRPIAQALAAQGHTVTLPRLPGHGTTVQDMIETDFNDWATEVETNYQMLARSCEKVAVVGLSMGGTLTLDLASRHSEVASIVVINAPSTVDPEMIEQIQGFLDMGGTTVESIGNDIAKPDVDEVSYDETPLAPALSLTKGITALLPNLANITMPTLLITSRQDHVVDPSDSDHTATKIGVEAERLWLDDSYHVATLDYDQEVVIKSIIEFVGRTTS